MPTTTFTQTHSSSGDAFPTVTVSGITGTVTGINYTVNFNASNPSAIYASVVDTDNNNQNLFGSGTIATGSPPYTYTEAAENIPTSVNGSYDFSVQDAFFGSGGLNVTSVEVEITTAAAGNDYQLTLDDGQSSSQISNVDVQVLNIQCNADDSQSQAQCSDVNVTVDAIPLVLNKAESQAQASDVDVVRDLSLFSLESQAGISPVRMYDKRPAIRTVHFW